MLEAVQARVNSDNTTAIIVALNSGIDSNLERNANLGSLMDSMKMQADEDDPFSGFDDDWSTDYVILLIKLKEYIAVS